MAVGARAWSLIRVHTYTGTFLPLSDMMVLGLDSAMRDAEMID